MKLGWVKAPANGRRGRFAALIIFFPNNATLNIYYFYFLRPLLGLGFFSSLGSLTSLQRDQRDQRDLKDVRDVRDVRDVSPSKIPLPCQLGIDSRPSFAIFEANGRSFPVF